MRLEEGAYRELHWHSTAEWAYMSELTKKKAGLVRNLVHTFTEH